MNTHTSTQNSDEFIAYPTNTLFGIINDVADAENALLALTAAGFSDDTVQVYCGEAGAARIDASGIHHGRPAQLMRLFQATTGERAHADRYEKAALEGHHVIAIQIDDADSDMREDVRQTLKAHSGHFINFYGRRVFRKLDL